jgi:hypothetical protein
MACESTNLTQATRDLADMTEKLSLIAGCGDPKYADALLCVPELRFRCADVPERWHAHRLLKHGRH